MSSNALQMLQRLDSRRVFTGSGAGLAARAFQPPARYGTSTDYIKFVLFSEFVTKEKFQIRENSSRYFVSQALRQAHADLWLDRKAKSLGKKTSGAVEDPFVSTFGENGGLGTGMLPLDYPPDYVSQHTFPEMIGDMSFVPKRNGVPAVPVMRMVTKAGFKWKRKKKKIASGKGGRLKRKKKKIASGKGGRLGILVTV